jgi:glycosyltransferase involved in cell wall biosynthesis
MRLLHLYSGNLFGGIERVLVTLARSPAEPSLQQQFALFFDARLAGELRAAGTSIEILGRAGLSRPWQVVQARRRFRGMLERVRPDVVLAHSPWALAMAGATIRQSPARSALWLHNPPTGRLWPDGLVLRRPSRLHVIIANSRFTAETSRPVTRVDGWVHPPVAPQPEINLASRAETRRRLGAGPAEIVILQASRLERWKGLHVQIAALALLRDLPGWVLWIAGGPQRRHERVYLQQLHQDAVRARIGDRVRFLGHRDDVSSLMAAADVYSQPNVEPEPFGVALVEAMGAGRPVMTSAVGGLSRDIDGRAGLVVSPGDAVALAAGLRELITLPSLRQALGSQGPILAAHLCDPARQLRRLCRALLAGGPGDRADGGGVSP